MLSVGIVGLPNVGKSTLFESLTKKQVDKSDYPFCTINPNVGVVAVPDERVDKLFELCNSKKKIYTAIEFVDIAGLIEGANKGEGLGNKFLANIRETNAICYVLKGFRSKSDEEFLSLKEQKEILDTELILKDLETVEKRLGELEKKSRTGDKELLKEMETIGKAKKFLEEGKVLSETELSPEEREALKSFCLLTMKKRLYILNGEKGSVDDSFFKQNNIPYLVVDILTELEAADLTPEERLELGLNPRSALNELIKKTYELLDLITFFTVEEDETRGWTIEKGTPAPKAGGVIHSDFEDCFIKASVINWQDLINVGGLKEAKSEGLLKTEGKNYIVQDGDVIEIKHNA